MNNNESDTALLDELAHIVGPQHVVTDAAGLAPHSADWRGAYAGRARAVVKPANTEAVAAVVQACGRAGVPLVPQGGNTGMCGGALPDASGAAVVLALGRMNRIRALDALNQTVTVDAGCVLQTVQAAAQEADLLFPLSLGAEGSCQIGGNLATNAGGINVLRYGNARELVLGLEVVLPDGRIWNGLRALRKDNRGYDLKQLFIGAEGTLGIITGAVLKLFPRPRGELTALLAIPDADAAVRLLASIRAHGGDALQAFELIARPCLDLVLRHSATARDPFVAVHPWYLLLEFGSPDDGSATRAQLEQQLADALESGRVKDAVIAETLEQSAALWRLRESIPEATRAAGPAFRSDIAVAVDRIPAFIEAAQAELRAAHGAPQVICFGHVGDGNLHFNALAPHGVEVDPWSKALGRALYDIVQRFDGSFSAEHGIGQAKCVELLRYKSAVEIDLMRSLKRALDPANLMNPGKVLNPTEHSEHCMDNLGLQRARELIDLTLRAARRDGLKPLAIVVIDAGGHDVALLREDGCAFLRAEIARGKAWGALGMGMDSRVLGQRAEQNPRFFAALGALSQGKVIPNAGGLLLHGSGGAILGAIGVSGDQAERDEAVALDAMRQLGLAAAAAPA